MISSKQRILFRVVKLTIDFLNILPFFVGVFQFFFHLHFQMRPSGTHLHKRVCPTVGPSVRPSVRPSVGPSVRPSIRPSVRPLRLCENRVSRLFLATVRSYSETNDQPTCFESLLYYSVVSAVCSSICLSIYVT